MKINKKLGITQSNNNDRNKTSFSQASNLVIIYYATRVLKFLTGQKLLTIKLKALPEKAL